MSILLVFETGDEDIIFAEIFPTKSQIKVLETAKDFVLGRTPDEEITPAIGKALIKIMDAFRTTGPYNTLNWGGIWQDTIITDKTRPIDVDQIIHCGIL